MRYERFEEVGSATARSAVDVGDSVTFAEGVTLGDLTLDWRNNPPSPVTIGDGAVIYHRVHVSAGAVIGASAVIGQDSYIWPDAVIEEGAVIGSDCMIGTGATVRAGVRVPDDCKVEAGATVSVGDSVARIGPYDRPETHAIATKT